MGGIVKLTAIMSLLIAPAPVLAQAGNQPKAPSHGVEEIERGEYVTMITGCNDCHTSGYAESGGQVPIENWLTGSDLGFRGPWGTTYAINLRLYFQTLSEDQWVDRAKGMRTRPPMPWFSVNVMVEDDVRAMYAFVRSLGPAGKAAPQALPLDEPPNTPTVDWPMPR
jgi:mono/diheme cytochrome c family protein